MYNMEQSIQEKQQVLEKLRSGNADIKDDLALEIPVLCSELIHIDQTHRLIYLRILGNAIADHEANRSVFLHQDPFFEYLASARSDGDENMVLCSILFNLFNSLDLSTHHEALSQRLITVGETLGCWIAESRDLPDELVVFLLGTVCKFAASSAEVTKDSLQWTTDVVDYLIGILDQYVDVLEIVEVLARVVGIDQAFEKHIASREDYIMGLLDFISQDNELCDWGIGLLGTVSSQDVFLETVSLERPRCEVYNRLLQIARSDVSSCSIAGCMLSNLASNNASARRVSDDVDFGDYINKCMSMNLVQLQCINLLKNVSNHKDVTKTKLVPSGIVSLLVQLCTSEVVTPGIKAMALSIAKNVFGSYGESGNEAARGATGGTGDTIGDTIGDTTGDAAGDTAGAPEDVKALAELILGLFPSDEPSIQNELVAAISAGNPRILYTHKSQANLASYLLSLEQQSVQTAKCLALLPCDILASFQDKLDSLLQVIAQQPKPVQNNLAYLASQLITSELIDETLKETSGNAIAFYTGT